MADDAYLTAVRMLARRELSELQIRQRLRRKAFSDEAVDENLAAAGITGAAADAAIEEATSQVDMDALLEAALARRLGADGTIDDDRTMSRLYRQLTSQGFEQNRVLKLLRSRRQ